MILSHKHKFIYFKTKKSGGTTIQKILIQKLGDELILGSEVVNPNTQSFWTGGNENGPVEWSEDRWGHNRAANVQKNVNPEVWDYLRFAIIKNPWHAQVSWFHHVQSLIATGGPDDIEEYLKEVSGLGFIDFSMKTTVDYISDYSDVILDVDDNPCMNYYIRHEYLLEDFNTLLRMVNLPEENNPLPVMNKHTPDGVCWQDLYEGNQELIDKVAENNKAAIEIGGYVFS